MEETSIIRQIFDSPKFIYLINRETGEIWLFGHYFCLDFQSNIVFKIENNTITPACFGQLVNNLWHFRGPGLMSSHKDPFVAAFKVLYYAHKYNIFKSWDLK